MCFVLFSFTAEVAHLFGLQNTAVSYETPHAARIAELVQTYIDVLGAMVAQANAPPTSKRKPSKKLYEVGAE